MTAALVSAEHTKARWATARLNQQLAAKHSRYGMLRRTPEGRPYLLPNVLRDGAAVCDDRTDQMDSRSVSMLKEAVPVDFNSSHSGRLGAVAVLSRCEQPRSCTAASSLATADSAVNEALSLPVLFGLDVEEIPRLGIEASRLLLRCDDNNAEALSAIEASCVIAAIDSYVSFAHVHIRRQAKASFTAQEVTAMLRDVAQASSSSSSSLSSPLRFTAANTIKDEVGVVDCAFDQLLRGMFSDPDKEEREGNSSSSSATVLLVAAATHQAAMAGRLLTRFHQQWTYKESILKALGVGIPFGVRRIQVYHQQQRPLGDAEEREPVFAMEEGEAASVVGNACHSRDVDGDAPQAPLPLPQPHFDRAAPRPLLIVLIDGIDVGQWLHLEALPPMILGRTTHRTMCWPHAPESPDGERGADASNGSKIVKDDAHHGGEENADFVGSIALFALTSESRFWFATSMKPVVGASGPSSVRLEDHDRRPTVRLHHLTAGEVISGAWLDCIWQGSLPERRRRNTSCTADDNNDDLAHHVPLVCVDGASRTAARDGHAAMLHLHQAAAGATEVEPLSTAGAVAASGPCWEDEVRSL